MKKIILLVLVIFSSQLAQAQNSQFEKAANYAADQICLCVNKVYSEIDNEVKNVIVKLTTLGPDEADAFVMSLTEDVQMRLLEQSLIMMDEAKAIEFENCTNKMVADIEKKFQNLESMGYTEDQFMEQIIQRLSAKKSCEFTHFLLLVGLQNPGDDDFEEPVIKKGNNSGGEERQ